MSAKTNEREQVVSKGVERTRRGRRKDEDERTAEPERVREIQRTQSLDESNHRGDDVETRVDRSLDLPQSALILRVEELEREASEDDRNSEVRELHRLWSREKREKKSVSDSKRWTRREEKKKTD